MRSVTICLNKTEFRMIHYRCKRRQIARICQLIQADDPVVRILVQHMKYKVASYKSGSTGYDDRHM